MNAELESASEILADRERLRAALKPFARAAAGFDGRKDASHVMSTMTGSLTVGDFRRAVAALPA